MNATDYSAFIRDECIRYDFAHEREYLLLGLAAEIGEVAGVLAKHVRDCGGTAESVRDCPTHRMMLLLELGDVMWFCYRITDKDVAGDGCEFRPYHAVTMCDGVDLLLDRVREVYQSTTNAGWWPDSMTMDRIAGFTLSMARELDCSHEALLQLNVDKLRDRRLREVAQDGSGVTWRDGDE